MNITIWTKTLLGSYANVDNTLSKIEKSINIYIDNCFASRRDASEELNGLIKLLLRKKNMQLLQKLMDGVISNTASKNKEIIKLRYLKNMSYNRIGNELNISIRSVFRKQEKEIELMQEVLLDLGYDEYIAEEIWGSDPVVIGEYNKALNSSIAYSTNKPIEIFYYSDGDGESMDIAYNSIEDIGKRMIINNRGIR